jgi:hypothetical protein
MQQFLHAPAEKRFSVGRTKCIDCSPRHLQHSPSGVGTRCLLFISSAGPRCTKQTHHLQVTEASERRQFPRRFPSGSERALSKSARLPLFWEL